MHYYRKWFSINSKFSNALIIFVSFISFLPIFLKQSLLDRDLNLVIGPLSTVRSLSDYSSLFLTKSLMDIQPVRDFFLLIDIHLGYLFDHQVFGLSNWLLWVACCFCAERIILKFYPGLASRLYLTILACHPMLAWVISWPLAKKHLLATLFCLLASLKATEFKLENKKTGFWIFSFYFLALLSQPIIIFWPVVFFIFLGKSRFKADSVKICIVLFLTAFIVGSLNWLYYSKLLEHYLGFTVTQPPFFEGLARRIFSLSRGFTQILIPVHYAGNYSQSSLLGLLGIPATLIFLFLHTRDKLKFLFFLLLLSYPLVATNISLSSVFLSDTYLLISLAGFYFIASSKPIKSLRLQNALMLFLLLVLIPKTIYESRIASTNNLYIEKSYEREPECKNIISLVELLLLSNNLEKFQHHSGVALKNRCFVSSFEPQVMINDLYAFRLYLDPNISLDKKLKTLKTVKIISPDILVLQIILLNSLDRSDLANEIFEQLPSDSIKYQKALKAIIESDCPQCPKIL